MLAKLEGNRKNQRVKLINGNSKEINQSQHDNVQESKMNSVSI